MLSFTHREDGIRKKREPSFLKKMEKQINVEIDVTKFVNIDDKPLDMYIGGKVARHLEAGEEQIIPIWVAQVGAKHLVDRVLQEKHNVKDTLHDTELRRSLFAKILPDMAEERKIKPLSDEEFRKAIEAEQKKQSALIEDLSGKAKDREAESQKIKELEEQIISLKKEIEKKPEEIESPKKGRPKI